MPIHPGVLSHISYHDHFIQKRHLRYEHNDLITLTRVFGTEHLGQKFLCMRAILQVSF